MIFFMLVIATLIPIFVTTSITIRKGFIEINHLSTFLFGYVFYWIFPIISGSLNLFANEPLMDKWYSSFEKIEPETKALYIILCFLYWLSFIIGNTMGSESKLINNDKILGLISNPHNLNERRLLTIFIVTLLCAIGAFYQIRNDLFVGYTNPESIADPNQARQGVGTANALSAVLFIIFLIKVFFSNLPSKGSGKLESSYPDHFDVKKNLYSIYAVGYLFFAALIVSLGSRLYFLSNICAVLIHTTNFCFRLKIKNFIVYSFILVSVFSVYGTTRLGLEYKLSLDNIIFSLVGETVYTSFTLVSFLESNQISFFRFPFLLILDTVNLLPSFIFPEKTTISYSILHGLDSPLGAFHSFTSLSLNFGIIGTLIVFFFSGFFMGNIRMYATSNKILRLVYVLISSNIAFTLFRDPFSLSIIKNIFEFSIFVPIVLCTFVLSREQVQKQS